MRNNSKLKTEGFEPPCDVVWGAAAIGNEINCPPAKVYYLFSKGLLRGAVKKLGHKTFIGSRSKLRQLFLQDE
jgi:hypothetical protein